MNNIKNINFNSYSYECMSKMLQEKFTPKISLLNDNILNANFNNELKLFLEELNDFIDMILKFVTTNLHNILIIKSNLITKFLINNTTKENHLLMEILMANLSERNLQSYIDKSITKFPEDHTLLDESISNYFSNLNMSILTELIRLFSSFKLEHNILDNSIENNSIIQNFANSIFDVISEKLGNRFGKEKRQVFTSSIIHRFKLFVLDNSTYKFCRILTNIFNNMIKVPENMQAIDKANSIMFERLLLYKQLEEKAFINYRNDLLKLNKSHYNQDDLEEIKLLYENIYKYLIDIFPNNFKHPVQQKKAIRLILIKLFSFLFCDSEKIDIIKLMYFFLEPSTNEITPEINHFLSKMQSDFKRNMECLAKMSNESYNSEIITELPRNLCLYIDEYYDTNLFLFEDNIKYIMFREFYKPYYKAIPRLYHFHILYRASGYLGCHVTNIDPTETINADYISDLISFKFNNYFIDFEEAYKNIMNTLMYCADFNDLKSIDLIILILNIEYMKFINMYKGIIDHIHLNIEKEKEFYLQHYHEIFNRDNTNNLIQYLCNKFINIVNEQHKLSILNYSKENQMQLSTSLIELIEARVANDITLINHLNTSTYGDSDIKTDDFFSNLLQYNITFSQELITNNYIAELRHIITSIEKWIPHIPYLINELTAAQYIVFAYILDSNLRGISVDLTDKKVIEKIAGVAPKTAYDIYNKLVQNEFILVIENNGKQYAAINAHKIAEIARIYYRNLLSK